MAAKKLMELVLSALSYRISGKQEKETPFRRRLSTDDAVLESYDVHTFEYLEQNDQLMNSNHKSLREAISEGRPS